eukprot:1263557-Amphidinium_carterae.2
METSLFRFPPSPMIPRNPHDIDPQDSVSHTRQSNVLTPSTGATSPQPAAMTTQGCMDIYYLHGKNLCMFGTFTKCEDNNPKQTFKRKHTIFVQNVLYLYACHQSSREVSFDAFLSNSVCLAII